MRTRLLSKSLVVFSGAAILFGLIFVDPAVSSNRFRVDPDRTGKIVDFDTGKPISGVVVMALWTVDFFRLVIEPKTEYHDYFETVTDENGEFKIPGQGVILLQDINPPKFLIFKTGYGAMHLGDLGVYFKRDSPFRDRVRWVEGKPVISFRKESLEKRKETVQRLGGIPFNEMAVPGMREEKYRLYREEVTNEYHALGMTPYWERNSRFIRVREGGVVPGGEVQVQPQGKK